VTDQFDQRRVIEEVVDGLEQIVLEQGRLSSQRQVESTRIDVGRRSAYPSMSSKIWMAKKRVARGGEFLNFF
jgi:hypothetical protein